MERTVPMHERGMGGYFNWLKWLVAGLLVAACAAAVVWLKPWQFGQSSEKQLRSDFITAQKQAVASPEDVDLLVQSYTTGKKLADYYLKTGSIDRAHEVLNISSQSLGQLVKIRPNVVRYKVNLAITKETLGVLSNQLGETARAEQDFAESVALWRELAKLGSDTTDSEISQLDIQNGLADSLFNYASFLDMRGQTQNVEALYKESIGIREEISREHPNVMANWIEMTRAMRSLGILYHRFSWFKQSEEQFDKCIAIQDKLAKANPTLPDLRDELGVTYNIMGGLCCEQQRYERAEQLYLESVGIFEQLTINYPDNGKFKEGYASALTSLANIYYLQGKVKDAQPLYTTAHEMLMQLVKLHPAATNYKDKLAASYYNMGQVNDDLDNINMASRSYESALMIQKELHKKYPENPGYRNAMASTLHARGRLEVKTDRDPSAERTFSEAREIWSRLIEDYPNNMEYRRSLSALYNDFADLCTSMNDTARATDYRELSNRIRTAGGL